jgi:hypothetical protein
LGRWDYEREPLVFGSRKFGTTNARERRKEKENDMISSVTQQPPKDGTWIEAEWILQYSFGIHQVRYSSTHNCWVDTNNYGFTMDPDFWRISEKANKNTTTQ